MPSNYIGADQHIFHPSIDMIYLKGSEESLICDPLDILAFDYGLGYYVPLFVFNYRGGLNRYNDFLYSYYVEFEGEEVLAVTGFLGDDNSYIDELIIPSHINGEEVRVLNGFANGGSIDHLLLPSTLERLDHMSFRGLEYVYNLALSSGIKYVSADALDNVIVNRVFIDADALPSTWDFSEYGNDHIDFIYGVDFLSVIEWLEFRLKFIGEVIPEQEVWLVLEYLESAGYSRTSEYIRFVFSNVYISFWDDESTIEVFYITSFNYVTYMIPFTIHDYPQEDGTLIFEVIIDVLNDTQTVNRVYN